VKKLENDKPLRFEGKALEDGTGSLQLEGYILGLDERMQQFIGASIDRLSAEMNDRCDNTKQLLAKFKVELLKDAAKIIVDVKNDLARAQSEIEALKNKITEMKKPKSSIPFRLSDYAEIQRLKAEQNEERG